MQYTHKTLQIRSNITMKIAFFVLATTIASCASAKKALRRGTRRRLPQSCGKRGCPEGYDTEPIDIGSFDFDTVDIQGKWEADEVDKNDDDCVCIKYIDDSDEEFPKDNKFFDQECSKDFELVHVDYFEGLQDSNSLESDDFEIKGSLKDQNGDGMICIKWIDEFDLLEDEPPFKVIVKDNNKEDGDLDLRARMHQHSLSTFAACVLGLGSDRTKLSNVFPHCD